MSKRYASATKTRERRALNHRAFTETVDAYVTLKSRSTISSVDASQEVGGSVNLAKPSALDFFCDVDNQVSIVVKGDMLQVFIERFIVGNELALTLEQANYFEQRIGQLFVSRGIWPTQKYFKVMRQKNNE
jgi:hypothetical protein